MLFVEVPGCEGQRENQQNGFGKVKVGGSKLLRGLSADDRACTPVIIL